ncbi:hypothetical protein [Rhizobium mesosinicum]|uniref:Uncharacterized protein n=1 Tax=Rhizobium mesosinicum TaxID=335017 RepID=A0ABS7H0P7_9HYPH|nr:hypothetical protein [Rhizobium mesosinicum]MBW9055697.1 hypothetical protein [Rhizobium mesosinicum]
MANTTLELAGSFAGEWLTLPFRGAEMRGNAGFPQGKTFEEVDVEH